MSYALDNALFQWQEGERGVREEPRLEGPLAAVLDELRRRLGSTFELQELAGFYAEGTDWAHDLAQSAGAGYEAASVVDAAFGRYAREAADWRGGRVPGA